MAKKVAAPSGAKPAATLAKVPKKKEAPQKREVKFEKKESDSDTEDKPEDEPEADQGNPDSAWD